MSVCDGCDNEDLEVKQEPMDSHNMKSDEFPPKSEDSKRDPREMLFDAQFQKFTGSGKWWNAEHYRFLFFTRAVSRANAMVQVSVVHL